MTSNLYWIAHARSLPRVAIMARPRAGDWLTDEISALREAGVGTVVSLLEPDEIRELGLQTEPDVCRQNGIDFLSYPIPDRGVPDDVRELSRLCCSLVAADKAVVIHCRAGIGRSALVAAFILTLAGVDADGALAAIAEARGLAVPDTEAQLNWLRNQVGSAHRS